MKNNKENKKATSKYIKLIVGFVIFIFLLLFFGIYLYLRNGNFTNVINDFFAHYIPISSPVHFIEADSNPPRILIKEGPFHTLQSRISITLKSNEELILKNSEYHLEFVGTDGEQRHYVLEITNLELGEKEIEVSFEDKFGNKTLKRFDIARTPLTLPGNTNIPDNLDWPNSKYVLNGDKLVSLVNKNYKLTTDYQPPELTNLKNLGLNTLAPELVLRAEAADSLVKMLNQLFKETGKSLIIASAYRSYTNQVSTYLSWVSLYGQENADTISARPGFSEHQLGTTVDFFSSDSGYEFTQAFANTLAGQWLANNSYKYGFVLSYPYGKDSITGYTYEPWHYRYIGIDNATKQFQSRLTLKEFLENL